MEYAILPLAEDFSESQVDVLNPNGIPGSKASDINFSTPLFFMLLVQSLFAGIVIGKVSEGTIFAGVKHSFILTSITLLVVTGTRAILG